MDAAADRFLELLPARGGPGYRTTSCQFTDYQSFAGRYEFRVTFTSKLGAPPTCAYSLSLAGAEVDAGGGAGSVDMDLPRRAGFGGAL